MRNGRYPFVMTFSTVRAITPGKLLGVVTESQNSSASTAATALADLVTAALKKGETKLPGVAALPTAVSPHELMKSTVGRVGDTNCAPLRILGS
jgi:hypothetical protein